MDSWSIRQKILDHYLCCVLYDLQLSDSCWATYWIQYCYNSHDDSYYGDIWDLLLWCFMGLSWLDIEAWPICICIVGYLASTILCNHPAAYYCWRYNKRYILAHFPFLWSLLHYLICLYVLLYYWNKGQSILRNCLIILIFIFLLL